MTKCEVASRATNDTCLQLNHNMTSLKIDLEGTTNPLKFPTPAHALREFETKSLAACSQIGAGEVSLLILVLPE